MADAKERPRQMRHEEVIERFRRTGALLEGHFILTSGLHSSVYLQCALVLQHPPEAEAFGRAVAEGFAGRGIETVVAPAIGGIVIGYEVARALGAKSIWTERDASNEMTLRRGFGVRAGESVLVVEDVITTGGSTRETIAAMRAAGASVVGAASIIDRSGGRADVGVPRTALATLDVPALAPSACPACQRGEVATKPGSRKIGK
ncbi:MAG: orotate phosphoribosyltransferase [Acidobacteriota bacterium]|nr:orotate phosphoribosyltransferase [Acidobacteriota bacterium]